MHQTQILLQEGYFRNSVPNILNVSRRTVYNYEHGIVFINDSKHSRPKGKSKLVPYYDQINETLEKDFTLMQCFCLGYTGKISILRDYASGKTKSQKHFRA